MLDNGHFVLGERAGFIRADNLRAAERFHGGKSSDNRVLFRHIGHADRKHDGHDRGKPFGNRGNRQRHREHEGVKQEIKVGCTAGQILADDAENKHKHTNAEHQKAQNFRKLGELFLKRGLGIFRRGECTGDFAHFGVHADARNHRAPAAVNDRRAHIHHVFAVAQRYVFLVAQRNCVNKFVDGDRFARKRRFFNFQACAFNDARVRRHGVARFEQNHIADGEVFAVDFFHVAVAKHF